MSLVLWSLLPSAVCSFLTKWTVARVQHTGSSLWQVFLESRPLPQSGLGWCPALLSWHQWLLWSSCGVFLSIFQWAETWASSLALKRSGCLINMSCLRISFEGRMLKLKLQYFVHLTQRVDSLEKTLILGGIGDDMWQNKIFIDGFKQSYNFHVYNIILRHLYPLESNHHHKSTCRSSSYSWPPSPILLTSQYTSLLVTTHLFFVPVSLFLFCLFYFLDSTYEWNLTIEISVLPISEYLFPSLGSGRFQP